MLSTSALPAIGTAFEGGFYGGTLRVLNVPFAIAWASRATGETKGAWLSPRADVLAAISCNDSLGNTLAMADAGSPIAKWALGLQINGFDDWCLPARDVLELAYRHLKPGTHETICSFRDGDNPSSVPVGYPYREGQIVQTSVELFRSGGPEAFEEAWYWASTQYSAGYAWSQSFLSGVQSSLVKSYEARARAVRLIQLAP